VEYQQGISLDKRLCHYINKEKDFFIKSSSFLRCVNVGPMWFIPGVAYATHGLSLRAAALGSYRKW
jgi:hypothetical protein